jgi:hypothetical protein
MNPSRFTLHTKFILLFIGFLAKSVFLTGQINNIAELKKNLTSGKNDTTKISAALSLSQNYLNNGNRDSAAYFSALANTLSEKLFASSQLSTTRELAGLFCARSLVALGDVKEKSNDIASARTYFQKAIDKLSPALNSADTLLQKKALRSKGIKGARGRSLGRV